MTIYIPVTEFENGEAKHGITVADSDKCRLLGNSILYDGMLYGNHAYTEPEGVWLYWSREDWKADKYRFRF